MRRTWLAIVLISAACADEIPEDVSAQMEAARAENEARADTTSRPDLSELLGSAPPGGHADWIADIRTGLDTVPVKAAVDRGEAQHAVQELYSRRFEPLRQFYGPGGAANPPAPVSESVERAGAQLQELMRLLASSAADAAAIEQAVRASQDALQQVENAARSARLPAAAPRDTISTDS